MLLGTVLALAFARPACAGETVLFQAPVLTEGAEVRCKPGTEPAVYVTQLLHHGDVVQVVEKIADGWLKIVPPKGSYSWVNTQFLRRPDGTQPVWTVAVADGVLVPVLVGTPYRPGKPDVVGSQLTRGAQVAAVGDPHVSEAGDGTWLPILPPPGEYRYIREKEVGAPSAGPTTSGVTVAHSGSAATQNTGAAPPADATQPGTGDIHVGAPAAPADVDPLLQQAEQLERSGDRIGAARLYDQLGNKYADNKHDVAIQYYNRAAWLRGSSPQPAPTPANEADALYLQARQYEQAGNWGEASRTYNRLGDLFRSSDYKLSTQYYNRAAWLSRKAPAQHVNAAPAAVGPTPTAHPAVVQARAISVQKAGPGRLAHSTIWIDGRATYVIESPQAQVLAYLAPQPGVDLERYVGQNVEVLGQTVARPDVRGQYMSVVRVLPLAPPAP